LEPICKKAARDLEYATPQGDRDEAHRACVGIYQWAAVSLLLPNNVRSRQVPTVIPFRDSSLRGSLWAANASAISCTPLRARVL
jgi:hypothetical protein